DLPPSAERAPLAAAAPEHRRPGPGAAAVGAREGFLPLDLREVRKRAVPRIDPPDRHRQAAPPGVRALLRRREEHHVQEVRDARDPRLRAATEWVRSALACPRDRSLRRSLVTGPEPRSLLAP